MRKNKSGWLVNNKNVSVRHSVCETCGVNICHEDDIDIARVAMPGVWHISTSPTTCRACRDRISHLKQGRGLVGGAVQDVEFNASGALVSIFVQTECNGESWYYRVSGRGPLTVD